ncbi:MAG TPA: response regulator transcription factor [Tepidisphaeraceae bacterium]|nr:response regulator transcription factor [Tepidisphaeraceae bacterium]
MSAKKAPQTEIKPAAAEKKKVMLVDDHPLVREGLGRLINDQADLIVSGEADGPVRALELLKHSRPDLVALDLSLAGGDGLELCKQLHELYPELPVLIISMHDESLYAERALRAGASGYVMKQAPQEQVMQAIRRTMGGETWLSDKMSAKLLRSIRGARAGADVSPLERLTDRELEIFRMIGQGLSVKAIADALFLSPKTIEAHKEHIKQKLNLETSNDLLQYAIQARAQTG